MKSTKASEEINKAKIHIMKAKKEISNYNFDGQKTTLIQLNSILDKLETIETFANSQSASVPGRDSDFEEKLNNKISQSKFK